MQIVLRILKAEGEFVRFRHYEWLLNLWIGFIFGLKLKELSIWFYMASPIDLKEAKGGKRSSGQQSSSW